METETIPAEWDGIVCRDISYWWGMDILKRQWQRTSAFVDGKPDSDRFQEFMFWRRISVIWTCSTIEAFINSEGTAWLGEAFYKDNLERLGILQKIHTLYALKYRVRLPRKLGRLSHVTKLFELRNSLVHPKCREVSEGTTSEINDASELQTIKFDHLRKIFHTVTALFEPDGKVRTDTETTSKDNSPDRDSVSRPPGR